MILTMPSSIGRRDNGDEVAVVPTAARRADGRSVTAQVPSASPALTPVEVGHPFGRRANAPNALPRIGFVGAAVGLL